MISCVCILYFFLIYGHLVITESHSDFMFTSGCTVFGAVCTISVLQKHCFSIAEHWFCGAKAGHSLCGSGPKSPALRTQSPDVALQNHEDLWRGFYQMHVAQMMCARDRHSDVHLSKTINSCLDFFFFFFSTCSSSYGKSYFIIWDSLYLKSHKQSIIPSSLWV